MAGSGDQPAARPKHGLERHRPGTRRLAGWANTSGEMPSRRQAINRLIERWQELRAFSRA